MATNDKTTVDVILSQASAESVSNVTNQLDKMIEAMGRAVVLVQKLDKAMAGARGAALVGSRYSASAVLQGEADRNRRRYDQLGWEGSSGRSATEIAAAIRAGRQQNEALRQQGMLRDSQNRKLSEELDALQKINRVQEANRKLSELKERSNFAQANGLWQEKRDAEAIHAALRGQLDTIREREHFLNRVRRTAPGTFGSELAYQGEQNRRNLQSDKNSIFAMTDSDGLLAQTERGRVALARAAEWDKADAARNLNLQQELQTVRQITTSKEVQNRLELLKLRQQQMVGSENLKEVAQARDLKTALESQLGVLKQQEAVQNRIAKQQQARESRRDFLRGDGGAGLFQTQAILAANYMAMNAARGAITGGWNFAKDFDNEMRQVQSIVGLAEGSMLRLREEMLAVAEQTKFTAVEVAQAAVTLGQAGLAVQDLKPATEAVSLLATAAGVDLKQAVEVVTSTIGVFNMEATRMVDVANIMTAAVNNSKLDLEKMTLGLQYAGNTAAQSGVSFEEVAASLAAMSNSGIRSGSTLGTGLRQILISLQKPSGEFKATLDRLGLTMADVDLQTKGLYGVMMTLQKAGFTAGDAIRSFEVRAAAAFTALRNNIGMMADMEESFILSSAAAEANSTQLLSLTNSSKLATSALGALAATALKPIQDYLAGTLRTVASAAGTMREYEGLWKFVGTAITSVISLGVVAWAGKLVVALLRATPGMAVFTSSLVSVRGALLGTTAAAPAAAAAMTATGAAGTAGAVGVRAFGASLMTFMPVLGVIALAVGTASLAMLDFSSDVDKAQQSLDKNRTKMEEAIGTSERYKSQLDVARGAVEELRNREGELTRDKAQLERQARMLQSQMASMGAEVNVTGATVQSLIQDLSNLSTQLAKDYVLSIKVSVDASEANLGSLQQMLDAQLQDARESLERMTPQAIVGRARGNARMGVINSTEYRQSREFQQLLRDQGVIGADGNYARDVSSTNGALAIDAALTKVITEARRDNNTYAEKMATALQDDLREVIGTLAAIGKQETEIQNLRKQEALVVAQQTPEYQAIDEAISRFEKFSRAQGGAIQDSDSTREQMALSQERQAAGEQLLGILKNLEGQMNDQAFSTLMDKLTSAIGTNATLDAEVKKTFDELTTRNLKIQADMAEQAVKRAQSDVKAAQSQESLDAATAKLMDALAANELARERLADPNVNPAAETQDREILTQQRQAENDKFRTEAIAEITSTQASLVKDTNEAQLKTMETSLSNLSDNMKKLTVAEHINAAVAQQLALIDQIVAQKILLLDGKFPNVADRTGAAYLAEREAIEAGGDRSRQVAQNDGQARQDRLQANTLNLALANANRDVGMLNRRLSQSKDAATVQANAATARADASRKLAAAQASIDHQFASDPDALPGQREQALLNAQDDYDRDIESIGIAVANRLDALDRKNGGGREPNPIKAPADALRREFDNRYIGVRDGYIDPQAGYASMAQVVDRAQAMRADLQAQITPMQDQNLKGQLSLKEQETLNNLTKRHGELTEFIRESESRILTLKGEQGELDINMTDNIRRYKEQSLNANATLDQGVHSVLGATQQGFDDLFSSIANGTASAGDAMKGLAISVIKAAQSVITQLLAIKAMNSMISGFGLESWFGGSTLAPSSSPIPVAAPRYSGGRIGRLAGGGEAHLGEVLHGGKNRDGGLYHLMNGEYVLRRSAVQMIGVDKLDQINALGNRKALGGVTGAASNAMSGSGGIASPVNVWLTQRDQVPVPGPNDIISVIGDDIARGGPTKKLIRSVMAGG